MNPGQHGEMPEEAGRLIGFALQPKLPPAKDPEYARLVARYRTDVHFRDLVDGFTRGLGLMVTHADELGFYLGVVGDSPLAYGLSDLKRERSLSDATGIKRGLYAIVALGIAAYFYPQAQVLMTPQHRSGTALDIDHLIRATCKELEDRSTQKDYPPEDEPAWKTYLREKETSQTKDGRAGQQGTVIEIRRMLEAFSELGLVKRTDGGRSALGEYQPLERFRQQIARLAGHELFEALKQVRQKELAFGPQEVF